jgi:hypothetical protein
MCSQNQKFPNRCSFLQDTKIGVIGIEKPERSIMDMKLQKEFAGGPPIEAFDINDERNGVLYSQDYGMRSKTDIQMQKEFNPIWRQDIEAYCGYSKISDDPYNPYSLTVKRVPMGNQ